MCFESQCEAYVGRDERILPCGSLRMARKDGRCCKNDQRYIPKIN